MIHNYIEEKCAEILEKVEKLGISIRGVLEDLYGRDKLVQKFRSTILALCLEVVRNYILLDEICKYVLGEIPKNTYKKYILRTVIYETLFRNIDTRRIIRVCKRNGIRITREDISKIRNLDIDDLLRNKNLEERISIKYSIPIWLVRYILNKFDDSIRLIESLSKKLPIYVRVRYNKDQVINTLLKYGLEVHEDPDVNDLVVLNKVRLGILEKELINFIYIQDKPSVIVSHIVNRFLNNSHVKILDLCSAPGGKAIHIADLSDCHIVGLDISYRRLLIEKKMVYKYSKDSDIDLICCSSLRPPLTSRFYKVLLLDPDCSSIGKLPHSPEIKLWLREHHVREFAKLQYKLLRKACEILQRNSILVYSTCTITFEENEENISKVCEEYGLEIVDICDYFPRFCNRYLNGTLRFFPHLHKTGGYFIACVRK